MASKAELVAEDRKIPVSNLDKVLYPKVGFTKGQVIDYYIRVAPVLLPHLKDRPLTMKRYPDGVEGFFFYEKKCPSHRPNWVKTAKVARSGGGEINYCVMNDLAALVWAANPKLRAEEVASILEQTASGRGRWSPELGYGVLDVAAAVARAAWTASLPRTRR